MAFLKLKTISGGSLTLRVDDTSADHTITIPISGGNILSDVNTKTINSTSLFGSGNLNLLTSESDTLASVTGRGATTDTSLALTGSANLTVAGTISASSKSFLINHPSKPGWKLQYGSLESPYHGIQLTGRSFIYAGAKNRVVQLPDYVEQLCQENDIQVQITNIGHSKTLFVEHVCTGYLLVGCDKSWWESTFSVQDYSFFYSITLVRKDIPNLVVEFESK